MFALMRNKSEQSMQKTGHILIFTLTYFRVADLYYCFQQIYRGHKKTS